MINERLLKGGSLPTTTTRNAAAAAAAADHQTSSCKVPCLGYCEQVISRCIGRSNLEHLNEKWRAYAVALAELAKKLTSQYNIITIIGPIDVQISEAIMNFQDNATSITDQVKRVCGEIKQSMLGGGGGGGGGPRVAPSGFSMPGMAAVSSQSRPMLNRLGKRAAPAPDRMPSYPMDSAQSPPSNQQRRQQQQQMQHLQPSTHLGQPLAHSFEVETSHGRFDHSTLGGATGGVDDIEPSNLPLVQMRKKSPLIINDIRDFILSTKNFWSQLPGSVCTSAITAIQANLTGACGGGSSSSAYNSQNNNYLRRNVANTQNCFQEPLEFTSTNNQDLRFRNETLRQIARLEMVHSKIQDALHGVEIDWTAGSSSSGTGSYPVVGIPGQNQQQPVRPPTPPQLVAQQPGEDDTHGSPDDDDNDDDPEPYEGSGGGDIDDQEPEDSESTTTITNEHTDSDECAEDDDPLCPPGDTTTQPGDGGSGNLDGAGDDQAGTTSNPTGASAVPPQIFEDGDIDTNGKPAINNDFDVIGNHIISAADQSAQKSAAHGSALHQLFVIQKFPLVQLLSTCVLVLALSVVTHNDHHLRLVHH